jgi:hypothetical protein
MGIGVKTGALHKNGRFPFGKRQYHKKRFGVELLKVGRLL